MQTSVRGLVADAAGETKSPVQHELHAEEGPHASRNIPWNERGEKHGLHAPERRSGRAVIPSDYAGWFISCTLSRAGCGQWWVTSVLGSTFSLSRYSLSTWAMKISEMQTVQNVLSLPDSLLTLVQSPMPDRAIPYPSKYSISWQNLFHLLLMDTVCTWWGWKGRLMMRENNFRLLRQNQTSFERTEYRSITGYTGYYTRFKLWEYGYITTKH